MLKLVEYDNQPDNFVLHWDLSACNTNGAYIFWDNFLDGMAKEYIQPAWFNHAVKYPNIHSMMKTL